MKRLLAVATCALLAFACVLPQGEVVPVADAAVEPPADASVELPADASVEPPADASVEPPPPPVTGKASVQVLPTDATSLSVVRSVVFTLELSHASGRLPVALELTSPGGLPFQRMEREVKAEAGQPTSVEFALPVAGTLVHLSRMHGVWTASFDTKGRALDTVHFELQP